MNNKTMHCAGTLISQWLYLMFFKVISFFFLKLVGTLLHDVLLYHTLHWG